MAFAAHIACPWEQQARHFAFLDQLAHFAGQLRMQVGQHHRIDRVLIQAALCQALEQPHNARLATAGALWRRQQRVGPGHDQDVPARLLHQQHPCRDLHPIIVIGAQPLGPAHPWRMPKQNAAIEPAARARQCGNTTVHNPYLFLFSCTSHRV
ncbi:hypothetical protein D3C81_1378250 [compost metagenome]